MGGNDPRQIPPPSAPPPAIGQQPVTPESNVNVDARVVINPQQRGSLSGGYNVYSGQGYSPYMTDVSRQMTELGKYNPDVITQSAERYDRDVNSRVAFLTQGPYVAQFSLQSTGEYKLQRLYDTTDTWPNGALDQFNRYRQQLKYEQARLDPYKVAGIQARRAFETLALTDPGSIAADRHVYPNANGPQKNGEAYKVMDVGGRLYGARYAIMNGHFETAQVFDMQDPTQARQFQEQNEKALRGEITNDGAGQRMGISYPPRTGGVVVGGGRGGTEVGVHVGDRSGTDVGVVIGTDRRGGVHGGGQVDVRIPGGPHIDVGIFKR